MRVRRTTLAVALALTNAGCHLVSDGARVIGYRTQQAMNDAREMHRDRRLAEGACAEACGGRSADWADGFKDGFAAHLFRGTNEPPPLPPAKYRTLKYQTPDGYRAAEDWLAGFRHGVADAQSRGLRDLVTGPTAYRVPPAAVVPPGTPVDVPVPLPAPAPLIEPASAVVTDGSGREGEAPAEPPAAYKDGPTAEPVGDSFGAVGGSAGASPSRNRPFEPASPAPDPVWRKAVDTARPPAVVRVPLGRLLRQRLLAVTPGVGPTVGPALPPAPPAAVEVVQEVSWRATASQ